MVVPRLRKEEILHVRKTTVGVLLGALACSWFLVFYMFLTQVGDTGNTNGVSSVRGLQQAGLADGAPPVYGTLEKIKSPTSDRHTEVVYALPSADIKGTALLLHGCYHHARKYFSASSTCENCIGLSEELRITRILMEQESLAVIAVTSHDRMSGCWGDEDFDHVKDALEYFKENHHITGPVLALGASSGGRFAAQLAVREIVDAALVGVMNLGPDLTQKWVDLEKKPPLYFAPMPRDQDRLEKVEEDYKTMNGHGPVVLDEETCRSRPIDASYLNERVPKLSMAAAQAIVSDLITAGHLDPITGFLVKDPTSAEESSWRDLLKNGCGTKGCLENQSLELGESPLAKALNRAWAFHEYCSEVTLKALQFFEKELGGTPFLHTWHQV